jgi:formylglycine-generating enzyme required for sulfatase activity
VIPVRLEECEVPERLRRWHWVNLFEERGSEKLRRALRIRAGLHGSVIVSAEPRPGEERVNPDDGQTYVWIPPGEFQMGCSPGDKECFGNERPAHKVRISRGFWLGQTPVTVGAYRRFAESSGVPMPPEAMFGKTKLNPQWSDSEQPMVMVTWEEAKRYCEGWAKGRFPTEAGPATFARPEAHREMPGRLPYCHHRRRDRHYGLFEWVDKAEAHARSPNRPPNRSGEWVRPPCRTLRVACC